MVCIEKRPYTLYGRLATLHFRYLTCLLDRGHIKPVLLLYVFQLKKFLNHCKTFILRIFTCYKNSHRPVIGILNNSTEKITTDKCSKRNTTTCLNYIAVAAFFQYVIAPGSIRNRINRRYYDRIIVI